MGIFDNIDIQNSAFLQRATSEDLAHPESLDQVNDHVNGLVERARAKSNGLLRAENMREVLDGLSTYGFTPERIYQLCNAQFAFLAKRWDRQHELFSKFEEYGCKREQVIKMIRKAPGLITATWQRVHGTPEDPGLLLQFEQYGITKKQLLSGIIDNPSFLNNSWERLCGTPEAPGLLLGLEQYGFSRQLLGKMIAHYSHFLIKNWEQIQSGTILPMESYGFSKQQIVTICGSYPNIFNFSWVRIHGTSQQPGLLLQLEQHGFSKEQVIDWCVRVPALLTYSWDRISTQLQLAAECDLPVSKELFIQSHQKTAWRFAFLKTHNHAISRKNLYRNHKDFLRRFGQDYEPPPSSTDEDE